MKKTLTSYEKAGRLFRLFGWLQLVVGGLITLAILIPALAQRAQSGLFEALVWSFIIFAVIAGISIFQLYLGMAIKEH